MVIGISPESSEIQKKITELIKNCTNAVHIKDDILIHGKGVQHDIHLCNVVKTLKKLKITLCPDNCELGKPKVMWFGNIYLKGGISPDPEKCQIINDWPSPTSMADVKSFL